MFAVKKWFDKFGGPNLMKVIMRYSVVLFATLLCVVMVKTGFAQGGSLNIQLPEIELRTLSHTQFPLMSLTFDLRDNNGNTILDLNSSQIDLQEDGQSREITTLSHEVNNDLVTSLALVIDVSGSTQGEPLQNAIQATNSLLDNLNTSDEVAFIAVRPDISVDTEQLDSQHEVGFTTDYDQIRQVVNTLEIKGEQTALYNAMFKAVQLTSAQNMKRRAIIVMTDGRDFTNSVTTANDPIDEANRNNIPIFTIGLGEPRDELYLERVAVRTGGFFQATNNPQELSLLFNEVLNSLKQEYTLTYDSGLLAKNQAEHQLKLLINIRGTVISDELYFNLFSNEVRTILTPAPIATATSTATPTPLSTAVFIPLATPTLLAGEQVAIALSTEEPRGTEIVRVTETARPTQSPTPTPIVVNLNLGLENQTLFERIEDNPSPIVIVGIILFCFILLIVFANRFYQRIKLMQKQQASESGDDATTETAVTKYSLPVTKEQNPISSVKRNTNGQEFDSFIVKDPSLDRTTQMMGNSDPFTGSGTVGSIEGSSQKSLMAEFALPVEIPQLIRIDDKQDFEINTNYVFVGRHPKSDILLQDETVSARHAVLIQSEEKILIQDIGSTNGTFVNGEQIERRKTLQDGDHLHFGQVKMLYRAPREENKA